MANDLTIPGTHDTAAWVDAIKLIDTDEPVIGGIDGVDNAQAIQLAKRTTWLRAVIARVVDAAEVDPASANLDQLLEAIGAMIAANIPEADLALKPGDLVITTRRIPPEGSLKANGTAVAVASYEDLAAAIYCGDTLNALAPWGYRCTNPATPSTTRSIAGTHIVLPDLRSEFLRGWDDGRGVDVQVMTGTTTTGSAAITALADTQTLYVGQSITGTGVPAGATIAAITSATAITISAAATATASGVSLTCVGRAFGSWQADALQGHWHEVYTDYPHTSGPGGASGFFNDLGTAQVMKRAREAISDGVHGQPRVASESRPRNVALLICIKY